MITSFTFVRKQPHLTDEEFFQRWTEHTRDWDLRDHPEISLNRLMMVQGDAGYTGIAENHWPDLEALQRAAEWYATPAGQEHWADLASFMDIDHSPTVIVHGEADVSTAGIRVVVPMAPPAA